MKNIWVHFNNRFDSLASTKKYLCSALLTLCVRSDWCISWQKASGAETFPCHYVTMDLDRWDSCLTDTEFNAWINNYIYIPIQFRCHITVTS